MGIKEAFDDIIYKMKTAIGGGYVVDDDDIDDEIDEAETGHQALNRPTATYSNLKRMEPSYKQNLSFVQRASEKKDADKAKIKVYSPKSSGDASVIADEIKEGRAVVLNILDSPISPEQSQRLCDYLVGVCYAVGAEVEIITDNILIMAPKGYEVSHEQKREIRRNSMAMASGFGRM